MSAGTKIQWADDTANFWRGCSKVSPGCAHCYAEKNIGVKMHGIKWGKGAPRVKSLSAFEQVKIWNRRPWVCEACGTAVATYNHEAHDDPKTKRPCGLKMFTKTDGEIVQTFHRRRVFSLSLGDWLDEEVPIAWLADMLDAIRLCSDLDFLLLTKRPENWRSRLHAVLSSLETADSMMAAREDEEEDERQQGLHSFILDWLEGIAPANVWLGVSVENQEMADLRVPLLLKIPAAVRFLSCEPLLGGLRLELRGESGAIDWVIVGGESGPQSRPCNVDWIRSIVKQCQTSGTACFVKQLGARPIDSLANPEPPPSAEEEANFMRSGFCRTQLTDGTLLWQKFFNCSDKKGGDILEWPVDLRVREFPKSRLQLGAPLKGEL